MSVGPAYTSGNKHLLRDAVSVFLTVFVATVLSFEFAIGSSGIYSIWWSSGVLLAALLVSRKQDWSVLLASGGVAILFAQTPVPAWQPRILWLTLGCMVEAGLAALIIRWWADGPFTLSDTKQTLRFVLVAVLLVPLVSAGYAVALGHVRSGQSFGTAFFRWYLADALGMATATPVFLAAYRGLIPSLWRHAKTAQSLGLLILLLFGGSILLVQPDIAVLGLLFPLVILVVVRMGWVVGALGVLILSILSSGLTSAGHGPFAVLSNATNNDSIIEMQIFLAALCASAAIVATLYAERLRMLQLATEKERSIRLLTESSPDVLLLTDLSSRTLYTTRAVTGMLGYKPVELYRKSFQIDLMHPDEIPAYADSLEAVRRQNEFRTLIYRIRRKDGSWMWAEGCISLYRDEATQEPIGFVNVIRNITHRKEAEDRLQSAYNELEVLAAIDSLTGVANRRHFDAVLDAEWKRATRSGTTISMLLIDVDFFKNFNDIYGHLKGDDCLRDIAATVSNCTRLATDMVSRFGGEEFAIILPETDEAGAAALAERIRKSIQSHAHRHVGNRYGVITVSIGCSSMVPSRGTSCMLLIEAADRALYRAKNQGRNTVVRASQMD